MTTTDIHNEASALLAATDGPPTHPRCAECDVPMWLIKIENIGDVQVQHFQCKGCDAKLTWSPPPRPANAEP